MGERSSGALKSVWHSRDETLGRVSQDVAQTPLGSIGFLQPLVRGAALAARRVPCGLLGVRKFVGERAEVRIGAGVRFNGGEDRVERCSRAWDGSNRRRNGRHREGNGR